MRPNPDALAQQLYLVSLALEQAMGTENWDEAEALLHSRLELIGRLEGLRLAGRAKEIMILVAEHEDKLLAAMATAKRTAGQEAASFALAQKAVQAYLAA